MVIDAANGVEPQPSGCCRSAARNTPIITFINKMDREVREPLELLSEIEGHLGMDAVPFRGRGHGQGLRRRVRHPPRPHARVPRRRPGRRNDDFIEGLSNPEIGRRFGSAFEQASGEIELIAKPRPPSTARSSWPASRPQCSSARPSNDDFIEGLSNPEIGRRFGSAFEQASGEIELSNEAAPAFDRAQFLAGKQTPVFFGSAINNFGVQEVLDALVEQARRPARAPRCSARCSPRNPSSPAWCSRCRPTWTPRTATRRLRARELRPLRARHAPEGGAHQQGNAAQQRGVVPAAAARAAGRGLCRRRHRHPQPRRAATRRRADRRRNPAVHRAAVLRARAVPGGRSEGSAAHQAIAHRPHAAGRGRRHPGVPSRGGRRLAAAGRGRPAAVRSGGAPAQDRVRRGRPHAAFALRRWITSDNPKALRKFMDANAAHAQVHGCQCCPYRL